MRWAELKDHSHYFSHVTTGLILTAAVCPSVHGITISTAVGDGADSFIGAFDPATNFGSLNTLEVKNAAPFSPTLSFNRKGYLRFDLSAVSTPINGASFDLTISNGLGGVPVTGLQTFNVYGLDDADVGEFWLESGLTWDNAPANDTASGSDVLPNATLLGQFSFDGVGIPGTTVGISGASLTSFLNADTNDVVTLLVLRETHDAAYDGWVHNFATKENGVYAAPILELDGLLIGDLNGDGFVGIDDLNIVLGNWNQNVPPANPLADPSGDGFVGIDDLNAVLGNWNAGLPPSAEASSAVPEPGAISILTIGSLILLRRHIL